jgi:hypothetical protein
MQRLGDGLLERLRRVDEDMLIKAAERIVRRQDGHELVASATRALDAVMALHPPANAASVRR